MVDGVPQVGNIWLERFEKLKEDLDSDSDEATVASDEEGIDVLKGPEEQSGKERNDEDSSK